MKIKNLKHRIDLFTEKKTGKQGNKKIPQDKLCHEFESKAQVFCTRLAT